MGPSHSLLALVCLAPFFIGEAQTRTVGSVGEITAIGVLQQCSRSPNVATVNAVRIHRAPIDTVLYSGQTTRVLVGDEFLVHRQTDVRLWINSEQFGQGALILAPRLLCPLLDVDTTIKAYTRPDTGAYRLSTSPGDVLRFGVLAGGAFIQWNSRTRQLLVVAGGHVVLVKGTELVITADSSRSAALLYVREGSITFPDDAGVSGQRGQLFELRPGVPPREILAARAELLRSAESDLSAHRGAFPDVPLVVPPAAAGHRWWRHPVALVAAGVISGSIVGCSQSETRCGLRRKPPAQETTVTIRLPF